MLTDTCWHSIGHPRCLCVVVPNIGIKAINLWSALIEGTDERV